MNINDIVELVTTRQVIIKCSVQDFDLIYDNEKQYQNFLENLHKLLSIDPKIVYLNNIYEKILILLSDQRNKYGTSNIIETTNCIIRQINSLSNYSEDTLNFQRCVYIQNQCILRLGRPIVNEFLRNYCSEQSDYSLSNELLVCLDFDRDFLLSLQQRRVSINNENLLYYISSLSYFTAYFKDYLTDDKAIPFINAVAEFLRKIMLELKQAKGIDKMTYKSYMEVLNNINEKNAYNVKQKRKELKNT